MYIRTYFSSEEEILFETSITLYKPPKTALDVSRNANTKPLEKPTLKSPLSPSPLAPDPKPLTLSKESRPSFENSTIRHYAN